MKKIIIILLVAFIENGAAAHGLYYENLPIKQWKLNNNSFIIEGSFCFYKNDLVYMEGADHKIEKYPLRDFSEEDQHFIVKKNNALSSLNSPIIRPMPAISTEFIGRTSILPILALLIVAGLFFMAIKQYLKVALPLFFLALSFTLYNFTDPNVVNAAFMPFAPNVNTFWDDNYFYIESKGIPSTHDMMVGISNHGWQQQVPIPQCYIGNNAWPIPLNPVLAANPVPVDAVHFTRGAIAIAVNGVPIFNVHTNTGVDSYLDGQLDNYGGHCGRADDYHYHIAPLHLYDQTISTLPIAYALDGYAVHGNLEPDGTPMQTLDANHGHLFNGVYHYHGTLSAPYMIGQMAGEVTEDNTNQLIPQAAATPVRTENWMPLNGALITSCTPNGGNNGYNLSYTLNEEQGYATNYQWNGSGLYTFDYVNPLDNNTISYNGFIQCEVPLILDESVDLIHNFLVFPNPGNGIFKLPLLDLAIQKSLEEISIYTLTGELIFTTEKFQPQIELNGIESGMYVIKIRLNGKNSIQKILIQ
jgi:hypothetical protein